MLHHHVASRFFACRMIGERAANWAIAAICAVNLAATSHVLANDPPCRLKPGPSGTVTEIKDAATLILDDKMEIRLIAVLPPRRAHRKSSGTFSSSLMAAKSTSALAKLVLGQTVDLAYDGLRRDRYGRSLAHLYVRRHDERIWVQRHLVEGGFARVASYRNNRSCIRLLQVHERAARDARRGLWSVSRYQVMRAWRYSNILRRVRTFQLVEGTVRKVGEARGRIFLNFGDDWKSDFTVSIARRNRKLFRKTQFDLKALEGKRIRVRGWIERWNGPMIKVTHPEQIEILEPKDQPDASPQKKDPELLNPGLRRI